MDALNLVVFPVVLGKGKRLFGSGAVPTALELVSSSVTGSESLRRGREVRLLHEGDEPVAATGGGNPAGRHAVHVPVGEPREGLASCAHAIRPLDEEALLPVAVLESGIPRHREEQIRILGHDGELRLAARDGEGHEEEQQDAAIREPVDEPSSLARLVRDLEIEVVDATHLVGHGLDPPARSSAEQFAPLRSAACVIGASATCPALGRHPPGEHTSPQGAGERWGLLRGDASPGRRPRRAVRWRKARRYGAVRCRSPVGRAGARRTLSAARSMGLDVTEAVHQNCGPRSPRNTLTPGEGL